MIDISISQNDKIVGIISGTINYTFVRETPIMFYGGLKTYPRKYCYGDVADNMKIYSKLSKLDPNEFNEHSMFDIIIDNGKAKLTIDDAYIVPGSGVIFNCEDFLIVQHFKFTNKK
jgi:hypothetical protein